MQRMIESIIEPERWLEEQVDTNSNTDDYVAQGGNPRLALLSAVVSNILLFVLIFGMSATVQVRNLRKQITNKFALGTGVAMQFLIMPFLGFCAVMILRNVSGFTEPMGISLLVVTASPGGSYSNWWCSLFNAELALSVAMTSVSSILSIGLLPANLFLYSWLAYTVVESELESTNVVGALDFESIFITLGVVLGAILLGLCMSYKYDNPKFHKHANQFGSVCGITLILFSIFLGSGAGGANTNFWSLPWAFYVGTAFPCVLGMTLANIIARSLRLTPPETVAISIEICYQNTAIATSVAVTMFKDPTSIAQAVSVPLFYGFVEAVLIGVYCIWAWKVGWTKAPRNEKICVVITKTYEVEEECHDDHGSDITEEVRTSWWARMFIPREQDHLRSTQSAEREDDDSPDDDRANKEDARDRFYSSDVTVATTPSSAPGSPETNLDAIKDIDDGSKDDDDHGSEEVMSADLEAPALTGRNGSSLSTDSSSVLDGSGN